MTINEAMTSGTERLTECEVPDAAYDAKELMAFATGMSEQNLLVEMNKLIEPDTLLKYNDLIAKRASRIPLQHLMGVMEFMGVPIKVDERVLCPRYDTETLVVELKRIIDEIYKHGGLLPHPDNVIPLRSDIYNDKKIKLLDLCTGSGCVAIVTAVHAKRCGYNLDITAVDASKDALAVAKENIASNDLDIRLLYGDLYEPVADERFHVISANPPYIATKYLSGLMPEVRDHEPRMALDGGEDGLKYYRRITSEAADHLEPGGYLLYEIGFDQGPDVRDIMIENNFHDVRIIKDLAGDDRVVCGRRQGTVPCLQ